MFAEVESTSSRLAMIEICTNYFRSVIALSPEDLLPAVYLAVNKIAPSYENLELGVGDALLFKAIAEATGRSPAQLKADVANIGDLGEVALACRNKQKTMFQPSPLSVRDVYTKLRAIASEHGTSSMKKKVDIITTMLVASKDSEAKYIIRALQGRLRIGLAETSVLVSLAHSLVLTPPKLKSQISCKDVSIEEAVSIVKNVYSEMPNYDVMIKTILDVGLSNLHEKCHLTPGVPVKVMLAKPSKGISEVLQRFGDKKFTLEYKYDGERAQIHVLPNGEVAIFSRNAENNTGKYPDLIARLKNAFKNVTSCIIDCEVVAYDTAADKILPFQTLSTRKRKDVDASEITVQICIYAFDLLYLNEKSLLRDSFYSRREKLFEYFQLVKGEFHFAKHLDSSDPEDITAFLGEAIANNCEGLMVKTLDQEASYEPDKRSQNWLKVKKDYLDGVGDTFDIVPIGAYIGKGKRTGVYGAYLLACYDPENEEYQCITKIGTGFKDSDLEGLANSLNPFVIDKPRSYYRYTESLEPDVWFEPSQVWEVLAADLSISPVHKAGIGLIDENKGIALRFPRFIRVRDDKKPEDATNSTQVVEMYNNQSNKKEVNGGDDDEDN